MDNLYLAIAHHLLAFGIAAMLAAEAVLAKSGLAGAPLVRLQRIDRLYGLFALLLIAVGAVRVVYGGKGALFYTSNPFFWAKMAAFAGVALFSILPTVRLLQWGRRARAHADFVVPDEEMRPVRRCLVGQMALFPLIPVFAAMMARGVGL